MNVTLAEAEEVPCSAEKERTPLGMSCIVVILTRVPRFGYLLCHLNALFLYGQVDFCLKGIILYVCDAASVTSWMRWSSLVNWALHTAF